MLSIVTLRQVPTLPTVFGLQSLKSFPLSERTNIKNSNYISELINFSVWMLKLLVVITGSSVSLSLKKVS